MFSLRKPHTLHFVSRCTTSAAYKTVTIHSQASDLFNKKVILLYDTDSEDQVFPYHTCMSWTLRPFQPPH